MSALGQKQTCEVAPAMSALPPKADIVRGRSSAILRLRFRELLAAPDLLPGWDQLPTFPIAEPLGNRPFVDQPLIGERVLRGYGFPECQTCNEGGLGLSF